MPIPTKNANKLTRRGKKNSRLLAAGNAHAAPVSTIVPTGIEPGSDRNCCRIELTQYREVKGGSCHTYPSIRPDDVERDTYLTIDDFGGQLGGAWHETDVEKR